MKRIELYIYLFFIAIFIAMVFSCSSLFTIEKFRYSGSVGHQQEVVIKDSIDSINYRSTK